MLEKGAKMTDIEKALNIVDWLLHHNKNLTKQQEQKLYELQLILQGD